LQLALAGVRELSLITTPPVDRLAVRTFVMPFDEVILREALMREHFRGGQSFYVVPRIADLTEVEDKLRQIVPELKFITAHGQMTPTELEDRMVAFYEGQYDLLLSTQIIESGLDIPSANTMIIHRAEMFGLAQLYQLRGRIGRSKVRGYAYLTYSDQKTLTKTALQRLQVIEQLDSLGAGFQLASHDMDIRGSGNLLGEEQSGHIKEVGVELYQRMLEEAVMMAKSGHSTAIMVDQFSPQINMAVPVLIPERYITDLTLRLTMYRRLSDLTNAEEVDAFAAELIDRFGDLPHEVDNLLKIVVIKILCRKAHIAKIDAGPKGAIISFYQDRVDYVDRLIGYVQKQFGTVKIRPDQKLSVIKNLHEPHARIKVITDIVADLAQLADQ
jgi:transcription-repair coupling factor (superfamily II helicase)